MLVLGGLRSLNPVGPFTVSGDINIAAGATAGFYNLSTGLAGLSAFYAETGIFDSNAASGQIAFRARNAGARLKLSSGGTLDYLVGDGNVTVSCGGHFSASGDVIAGTGGAGDVVSNRNAYAKAGTSAGTISLLSGVLNVNTTAVGNVGASAPDDLQTYQLPANALTTTARGVRIKVWGTTANNANAKTVRLAFGATPTALVTKQLTASIAGRWEIEAFIFRTGTNAQDYYACATNFGGTTVSSTDGATVALLSGNGTLTETEANALDIKVQSTVSTDNNDIVSEGLIVEYI